MANIIVTFSKKNDDATLEQGRQARTEILAIGSGAVTGTLNAGDDNVVCIYAEAACWVSIDSSPGQYVGLTAVGAKRRFMKLGAEKYFEVGSADRVAVITAA